MAETVWLTALKYNESLLYSNKGKLYKFSTALPPGNTLFIKMVVYSAQMTASVKTALLPYNLSLELMRSKPQSRALCSPASPQTPACPPLRGGPLLALPTPPGAYCRFRLPHHCSPSVALNLQKPLSFPPCSWALTVPCRGSRREWRVQINHVFQHFVSGH